MKTLALPKGSPDPLPELAAYLEPFASLFRRSTSRRSLERYVTGLLSDLPRKNCEAIAQTVANTSLEQLQHLLTDAAWDPLALDEQRVRLLVEHSPANGVLVLDDTGLPKQGNASVGVHHQYTGTLGKQGNCQIVVSAQYVVDDPRASRSSHWPVNARLYLPEVWAEDGPRCREVGVPQAITFASKPDLALHLIDRAQAWGVPFATIVTDAGYGIPSFLQALDTRELSYVCAVACDFGVRLLSEMHQVEAQQAQHVEQAKLTVRKRGQPKKPRPAARHDPKWSRVRRQKKRGRRLSGVKAAEARYVSSSSPFEFMQELVALVTVKVMGAVGRDPKAGSLGSDQSQVRTATSSGFLVICLLILLCLAWWNWRICAGLSSNSMRTRKGNVASITFRVAVGMVCIGIWLW